MDCSVILYLFLHILNINRMICWNEYIVQTVSRRVLIHVVVEGIMALHNYNTKFSFFKVKIFISFFILKRITRNARIFSWIIPFSLGKIKQNQMKLQKAANYIISFFSSSDEYFVPNDPVKSSELSFQCISILF